MSKEEKDFVLGIKTEKEANNEKKEKKSEGPKLIPLHWDPIGMSANELKSSIWGELQGTDKLGLGQEEMNQLASMFGRKETVSKKASSEESNKSVVEKSAGPPKLRTIDMSR